MRTRNYAIVAAALAIAFGTTACDDTLRGPVVSLYESPDCAAKNAAKSWAIVVKQTEQKQTVVCADATEAGRYQVGDTYPKG